MQTKRFQIESPNDPQVEQVGRILACGGLVAIPTETVYGLAGNALCGEVAGRIFKAKGRPGDNPLIVHISALSELAALVKEVPAAALRLTEAFWPGPFTMILKKADCIPSATSGGLDTVAVRMPAHPVARAIIKAAGVPLAAPSANTSGLPSPTTAARVLEDMDGKIEGIVDGGPCEVGVESTVLTLTTPVPRLLRPGGVTVEQIEAVIGKIDVDDAVCHRLKPGAAAASPGMKYKHYAPNAHVIVLKGELPAYRDYLSKHCAPGDFALCFEGEEASLPLPAVTFGRSGDPATQACRLFDALRQLDDQNAVTVYARCPKAQGVGLAVYNRLLRAAGFEVIDV